MKFILIVIFLFSVIGNSFAFSSNEAHLRYLKEYPEYKEADKQLNEAWKKLKSLCSDAQYELELKEQRSWIKERDRLARAIRKDDELYVHAAIRIINDRISILNYKIALKDPEYITFSIGYNVKLPIGFTYGDDIIADVAIVPSKPVFMSWYYTKIKNIKNEIMYSIAVDDAVKKYKKIISNAIGDEGNIINPSMYGANNYNGTTENGTINYTEFNQPLYDIKSEDFYWGTFYNSYFGCIEVTNYDTIWSLGNRGALAHEDSIYIDIANKKTYKFEDIFDNFEAAKNIITGIYVKKVYQALKEKYNDTSNLEEHDYKYDNIISYDFNKAYIKDEYVNLYFDLNELRPLNNDDTTYEKSYLENPIKIKLSDLSVAGINKLIFSNDIHR